ncbi:MAG: gliding motility protein GldM [Bacteroidales bacterium]|nr:gliding motility protein GldM [Bacteroidales bacterium]MBN2633044.1 gliding motility protein GldM [Bacteroidales bacterium]
MAHEKLSPRQKMIGMMYLVLTAMLALNVSKDTVKAFMKVDKGLSLTVENYDKKNALIYNEFEASFATYPEKTGPYRTKALEVQQRAEELFNFIQDIKIMIIREADGEDAEAINGREIDIEKVKKFDNNDVPSQILIGPKEDGKAYDLRAAINSYREFLISTLDGGAPGIEESLNQSLNTDDGKNEEGAIEKWPNLTFQLLPLVGANALLTKMQVDVRNAETEVLNYLFSQIDKTNFKFNKLDAVVIPKSTFVTLGSNYEASVFLSATDSTQQPSITVNGGQVLDLDENGRGIYTARASSLGTKKWGGVIAIKSPDGNTVEYKFESEYSVGEPNAVVSATAMNVMYAGIANPIDISIPGYGSDKVRITKVVNGTSKRERVKNPKGENFPGDWSITPTTAGQNVQIHIAAQEANGSLKSYPPREFRVKNLPAPIARLGGKVSGRIDRAALLAEKGIVAILPDADFYIVYNVVGFSVLYTDNTGDHFSESTNWQFTQQQRDLLNRLTRGKTLVVTNIKAVGPDKKIHELPAITLQIN